ncbi:MAG TPA: ABC transporter permease, partial [Terriglobales bacterium]
FDAFIVSRITGTTLNVGDHAETATGSIVTSNYFQALHVRPVLGRAFQPEEDEGRNAHPVTVISYELWQRRYDGDPSVVGRSQMLNGQVHTIVGVAPPGFYGTFVGRSMDFWVPVSMQERFDSPGYKLEDRNERWIEAYAMLKAGVTREQAQQEISAVAAQLEAAHPDSNRGRGIRLYPLWQTPFNQAGNLLSTLGIALVVVAFVLFIVCANVSNLLVARGFGRRHEITVRMALGAKRNRVFRQLLTEGFILSVVGAALGLLIAAETRNLLVLLLPGGSRMILPGAIDWRVLALSIATCATAAILFGLAPALQARGVQIADSLKAVTATVVGKGRGGFVRSGLVLTQIALSFTLLVGAGLLIASLRQMQRIDPGFDDSQLLTSSIAFRAMGYPPARIASFQDQIIDRVQALPGVKSAAFARITPFEYRGYSSAAVATDLSQVPQNMLPTINYNEIGPRYLATMGIPLMSGREFTRADDETSVPVAIVNRTMAERLWPQQDPVGQRIQIKGRWIQVVGVARTVKYRTLTEAPQPFFYLPLRQTEPGGILQIRTALAPDEVAKFLNRQTHALDPALAPDFVRPLHSQVKNTTATQQAALRMITLFAVLALILATVGLYGVMSYMVAQSTREMALRMALGAAPSDLLRLVMLRGVRLTVVGVLIGLGLALGSSRLLGYLLYKISPHDPTIYALAILLMFACASTASFIPAWRASRADPSTALRC